MGDLIAGCGGMKDIDMPAGYIWNLGGTYEDQQDTFADLATLMALMIILGVRDHGLAVRVARHIPS